MDGLALHIADGVIETPVAAGFAALAVAVVVVCLARGRRALDDRLAPMAGLVAAFVFAAQMLNFPVLPGVSGHLVGGALAALLVGPWVAALCVSVVLVVQALVFADGGLSALGLNITNMALVGTAAAYLVIVVLLRVLPRTLAGLAVTAFAASMISVVVAALAFVGEYWVGGGVELRAGLGEVTGVMAGVHALIGIGEGLITAVTVVTVARVRPDLVYALRGARPASTTAPAPVTGGSVE
ncbi:MAG: cobalamin biosynthesis protein CbiM [Micromonosporaceae bacterium]|nr:cobalamin biosynthesis protein CbiM [Micromonosporaceae bacterium]